MCSKKYLKIPRYPQIYISRNPMFPCMSYAVGLYTLRSICSQVFVYEKLYIYEEIIQLQYVNNKF